MYSWRKAEVPTPKPLSRFALLSKQAQHLADSLSVVRGYNKQMITIYMAPFVTLAGVLIYGFAGNPKLQEIGRIMFAFGLLVTLMEFAAGHALHF